MVTSLATPVRAPVRGWAGRLVAALVLLAGWLVAGVVSAAPASAHAELVTSDPVDGSRLGVAPVTVSLTFSEDVALSVGFVHVADQNGRRVDAGPATHPGGRRSVVVVPLRPDAGDGGYLVSFQVVSNDSHPVSGAVAFAVGNGPLLNASGGVSDAAGTDPVVGAALVVVRWAGFAGLVLIGGLVFVVGCWPAGRSDRRARRVVLAGLVVAAVAAVAMLALEGPYAAGRSIGAATSGSLLRATIGLPYGRMLVLRLGVLAVLAVLLPRILTDAPRPMTRSGTRYEDVAGVAGLVLLATYAAAGHAVTETQPTVAVLADIAHLGAMACWLGGLVVVGTGALRHEQGGLALRRFSRLATGCVLVLAGTGLYRAWLGVGGQPAALWDTTWGRLVLVKVTAFVGVLAIARLSRRAVHRTYLPEPEPEPVQEPALAVASGLPPAAGGAPAAAASGPGPVAAPRGLAATVRAETAIGVLVLAVAAVLAAQAPGRIAYVRPAQATLAFGAGDSARVLLTPARTGTNTVEVALRDGAGRPLPSARIEATATLPSSGQGPLDLALAPAGNGTYRATTALPRAGRWLVVLRVRAGGSGTALLRAELTVR